MMERRTVYEGKVCAEKDTPIWILNELLKLRNLTPTYKLIDEFGLKVEVLAGDDSAEGSGADLEEAKHAAAKAFIMKRIGDRYLQELKVDIETYDELLAAKMHKLIETEKRTTNYVGVLHEYAQFVSIPNPSYSELHSGVSALSGSSCHFDGIVTEGRGKTGRIAKQKSSESMWKTIRQRHNM